MKRESEEEEESSDAPLKVAKSSDKDIVDDEPVACLHDVSYPEGSVAPPHSSSNSAAEPAKKFPFNLDPFQSEAINCIEHGGLCHGQQSISPLSPFFFSH